MGQSGGRCFTLTGMGFLWGCYNGPMATTTIQISSTNRDLLDELGELMMEQSPSIWSGKPPLNAIVGFAVDHTLRYFADRDVEREDEP